MSVFRHIQARLHLNGPPVEVEDGADPKLRAFHIEEGAFQTPFWIQFDGQESIRIDTLPWVGARRCAAIQVSENDPTSPFIPDIPTGLQIVGVTEDSLTLSWDAHPDAALLDGFVAYWSDIGDPDKGSSFQFFPGGTETGGILTSLPSGTAITVRISAHTSAGLESDLSDDATDATDTSGGPLTAGTSSAVGGDGVVFLNATVPDGGQQPYSYQWHRSSGGVKVEEISGATFRQYQDTDVTNDVEEFYILTATDAALDSVDYIEVSATPTETSLQRGPGLNQPNDHVPIFQLNTEGVDQLDFVNASGGGETNRDWITANGGNPASGNAGGNWSNTTYTQFNTTDPEIPWPCMEWIWPEGSPWNGAASIYTFTNWGPYTQVYMRQIYRYVEPFQWHPTHGNKGIRIRKGGSPLFHVEGRRNGPGSATHHFRMSPNQGTTGTLATTGLTMTTGDLIELEWLATRESAIGVQDGTLEVWVNGAPTTWIMLGFTGSDPFNTEALRWFNADPRVFSGIEISMFRGGNASGTAPEESRIRVGELYFSGKTT